MESKRLEFGSPSARAENGASELGRAIKEARNRYDSLLGILGMFGTETFRHRTLESDPDVFPHNFVRHARHLFIFPPQDVKMLDDAEAGELSGTRPYTLVQDIARGDYDESLVTGLLEITYDDAG